MEQVYADARAGKLNVLLVTSIHVLAREPNLLREIVDNLVALKVQIMLVNKNIVLEADDLELPAAFAANA